MRHIVVQFVTTRKTTFLGNDTNSTKYSKRSILLDCSVQLKESLVRFVCYFKIMFIRLVTSSVVVVVVIDERRLFRQNKV